MALSASFGPPMPMLSELVGFGGSGCCTGVGGNDDAVGAIGSAVRFKDADGPVPLADASFSILRRLAFWF